MDELELLDRLKGAFVADLMGAIIPGAIHNFANPLNSLTGRIKLLEMHLSKAVQTIEPIQPGLTNGHPLDKISRDVAILTGESERFLDLFSNFKGKIMAFSSSEQEMLNLAELIKAEVKFADYYLDLKHDVSKTLRVDGDIPLVLGNRAGYSLCLSSLINFARLRLKNVSEKKLDISVGCGGDGIKILIQDSGEKIPETCKKIAAEDRFGDEVEISDKARTATDSGCVFSLLLLKMYGFQTAVDFREGRNIVLLAKPSKTAN
jgi:signal transduction histidine kinase